MAGRGKKRKRRVKVIKGSRVLRQRAESPKRKSKLPVTCGNKKGVLHKDRFNKGEPCIFSNGQWFTPPEFEKFGGKDKNKKWKISIFHNRIGLQTLIEDGILSSPSFKAKRSQVQECRKKLIRSRSTRHSKDSHTSESVRTSDWSSDDDDEEDDDDYKEDDDEDDDDEEEDDGNDEDGNEEHYDEDDESEDDGGWGGDNEDVHVNEGTFSGDSFNVTCSQGKGVLHVTRFATETCGKCIRTQDAWLTPKDFLNQNKPDGNWRRDIVGRSLPLGNLIMERVLKPHMVNCKCSICTQEPLHMLDQNNDDTCFKCSMDGDLVCCDKCPRAFHHHCHKPALRDDTVGEHWTCSFCSKSVPAARNHRC